jgi:hypothetical protein
MTTRTVRFQLDEKVESVQLEDASGQRTVSETLRDEDERDTWF